MQVASGHELDDEPVSPRDLRLLPVRGPELDPHVREPRSDDQRTAEVMDVVATRS